MSEAEIAALVLLIGLAIALAVWSALRPLPALRALLVILPLHSAAILFLNHVINLPDVVVSAAGGWKEGVLLGLLVAAARMAMRSRQRPALVLVAALAVLVVVAARVIVDVAVGTGLLAIFFGTRQLVEFALIFIAVAYLAPPLGWFTSTARWVVVVVAISAAFGILQPVLGVGFYDHFFHGAGQALSSSYTVDLMGQRQLRAVGTFVAPNEFGLALVIYLAAFILPLLALRRGRAVTAVAALLCLTALLLTFSRSAWVGAAVGACVAAGVGFRPAMAVLRRPAVRQGLRRGALLVAIGVLAYGAFFVAIGGTRLVVATVTGQDTSAAGRGASLAGGLDTTITNPGGIGLGSSGPRARVFADRVVLTENWYLVYGVQTGLLGLAAIVAFSLVVLASIGRTVVQMVRSTGPPTYERLVGIGTLAALVAALVGGLVIPSLFDLPASLTLWTIVAMVWSWGRTTRVRAESMGVE